VVPTSASELFESTEPTPTENGHTETDAQATETAEQAVPEVSIETNVEVSATTAEEAPTTTEPPKEDELPVPAEQAAEVEQPTGESSAPAEISAEAGPSSTAEVAAESSTAVADPTTTADVAVDSTAATDAVATSAAPASAEETAAAIALSAENAASAYKSRTRRRSSVSSTDSRETLNAFQPEVTPSMNRLSILYEGSQRRMCFDAEVVERIEVWREEGRIEVIFTPPKPDEEENTLLPKGYLVSDTK
jgi:20S proteasome subunit alpha 6